jgi:hypothetical protein
VETCEGPKTRLEIWQIQTDAYTQVPLFRIKHANPSGRGTRLLLLDDENWDAWAFWLSQTFSDCVYTERSAGLSGVGLSDPLQAWDEIVLLSMRGAGPAAWSGDTEVQKHILRRFFLLGKTLEEMQTHDLVQGVQAWKQLANWQDAPARIEASGNGAALLVYASLYFPAVPGLALDLYALPISHQAGPQYVNVLRHLDLPAATLLAAEKNKLDLWLPASSPGYKAWLETKELSRKYPGLRMEVHAQLRQ